MPKSKKDGSKHRNVRFDPTLDFNLSERARERDISLTGLISGYCWDGLEKDAPLEKFVLKDERFNIIKEYTQKIQECFIEHMADKSNENVKEMLEAYLSLVKTDQMGQLGQL